MHLLAHPDDRAGIRGVRHGLVEGLRAVQVPLGAPGHALLYELPVIEEALAGSLPDHLVAVVKAAAARRLREELTYAPEN